MPRDQAASTDYARFVVISANIRSLLEEPNKIPEWSRAVGKEIIEQRPVFAAIHLQGAKSKSDDIIDQLTRDLDGQPGFELFTNSRHFHDPFKLGLSSIYYATDATKAAIYDYQRREYWPADGHRNEHADSNFIKKERLQEAFGQSADDYTPSYSMTRWMLFDKPFNFINVCLSPDKSAIDGCQKWPSDSAQNRLTQLKSIISGLQSQNLWDDDATFVAGDFNCSINKKKFIDDQTRNNHAALNSSPDSNDKLGKLEALNLSGKKIFSINSNKFDALDMHDWLFNTCNGQMIRKYDQELSEFKNCNIKNGPIIVANGGPMSDYGHGVGGSSASPGHTPSNALCEQSIYFQPNWPFDYDRREEKDTYKRTDCPAWKNRILTNHKAWCMMHKNSFTGSSMYYGIVGKNKNIGDYKPVSLIATVGLN